MKMPVNFPFRSSLPSHLASPAIGLLLIGAFGTFMAVLFSCPSRAHLPIVSVRSEMGVDQDYRSRHALNSIFISKFNNLAMHRQQALDWGARRLGISLEEPSRFVVQVRDYPAGSLVAASSRLVRSNLGDTCLVALSSDQLALGILDDTRNLVHEYSHCAMMERMGLAAYQQLPGWLREGAALWAASQLQEQFDNELARAFLDGDWEWQLHRNLMELLENNDSLLHAAAFYDIMQGAVGEVGIRTWLGKVASGADWEGAFQSLMGCDPASFHKQLPMATLAGVDAFVSHSGLDAYREATWLRKHGASLLAVERLEHLVTEYGASPLAAQAWYQLGLWRIEDKDPVQAELAFMTILTKHAGHIGLKQEARRGLATSLALQGRHLECAWLGSQVASMNKKPQGDGFTSTLASSEDLPTH